MASTKGKASKKKTEQQVKISARDFAGGTTLSSRIAYFLNKKYGSENRTKSEWKKICKDENISL